MRVYRLEVMGKSGGMVVSGFVRWGTLVVRFLLTWYRTFPIRQVPGMVVKCGGGGVHDVGVGGECGCHGGGEGSW